MSIDIRKVKDMNGLITYLAEKLSWRIDLDDFEDIEDIAYDFEAEDIGLKEEAFVKIRSLRQLPPLVDGQKWGIFCVEFDSKRFEVTALRKILSGLIPKRRNSVDHAVWDQKDLLFICFWGSDNERTIGLAHFEDAGTGLPQIKMISCCPAVEDFTQIKVFEDRLKNLKWPANYVDHDRWQEDWSSAFTTGYKQTIRDASTLTTRLAIEARGIRDRILDSMNVETLNGYVHLLYGKFKNTLIHDMTEIQFADMYAQTVVYGLFSARCMDETQDDFSAVEAIKCIPNTNPFLKSLMKECLGAQNNGQLSFDELEIGNIVDLLLHTKTDVIIQDFNRQTGGGREDPVIHFYEDFLAAYDKTQKVQRGVYYTPQPIVNFIVRAVDSILKTEFNYEDGLATVASKKIKVVRESKRRTNSVYRTMVEDTKTVPAVQILDPATGTGTFLRQVILQIFENYRQKNKGMPNKLFTETWNRYVDEHLLPRINGFELMMAPYAVAHMKLAMVLKDTGYTFTGSHRLNVFLTNTLEEAGSSDNQLSLFDDPLALESVEANGVKKNTGINIIIGNPPYSISSSNKSEWILRLLDSYKEGLKEKKINLDDDYIKFIRYAQFEVSKAERGIIAFITNNSFLDGITHRKMRYELMQFCSSAYIIDLHGSVKRHDTAPDGSRDENVFDIQQGVSINIFVKNGHQNNDQTTVYHADLFGTRDNKYKKLMKASIKDIEWNLLKPEEPYYFFVPKDMSRRDEYESFVSLTDIFSVYNSGVKTDRDKLFVDLDRIALEEKMKTLLSGKMSDVFISEYRAVDSSSYKLTSKIKDVQYDSAFLSHTMYRPFDIRWIYYDPAIVSRPAYTVMQHMLKPNIALLTCRLQSTFDFQHAFITDCLSDLCTVSSQTKETGYCFPLYIYNILGRTYNFKASGLSRLTTHIGTQRQEDVFNYIYAVLYSPKYRNRYKELLKIDFPRIPIPQSVASFNQLSKHGARLITLHLLRFADAEITVTFMGRGTNTINRIKYDTGKVYINSTQYFEAVEADVWDCYIGGYQPLQKWLKDRKGQILTSADVEHYRKIVFALKETISIMREINEVIEI